MAFSMHSHSGQFCPGHAKDQLEDIVKHAIGIGFKTIGLTEHMPRFAIPDLYPEEIGDDPAGALAVLMPRHMSYLAEARRLQLAYADSITILIGFEGEWIRADDYAAPTTWLASHPWVDFFIGSLHHVRGIPIDFSAELYASALSTCGGHEAALYSAYYDEQHAMLTTLQPKIVGHFDLVRLLSAEPERKLRGWAGGEVWRKVVRNLEVVREYGGWLECNTSASRKGLAEPYPGREIAEEWLKLGGRFTFSDDSHGVAQLGTHYVEGLDYLKSLGVKVVYRFERTLKPGETLGMWSQAPLREKAVSIMEFKASLKLRTNQPVAVTVEAIDEDNSDK